jgi:hypothetical protein
MNNLTYIAVALTGGLLCSFLCSLLIEKLTRNKLANHELLCMDSRISIERLLRKRDKANAENVDNIETMIWSDTMNYIMTTHSEDNAIRLLKEVSLKFSNAMLEEQSRQVLNQRFHMSLCKKP